MSRGRWVGTVLFLSGQNIGHLKSIKLTRLSKKKKNSRLFNLTYDRPFLLDNLHRACHLFEIRRMLPQDQTMHLHSNSEALQLPLRRQAKWNFERQQLSLNYLEQFNHPKWVVEVVSDCAKSIFGLLSVRINLISLAQKNW